MQTMNRGGDVLARGGVRMDIAPGSHATQEQWDKAFGSPEPVQEVVYVFKCAVHGDFVSTRKAFLSGGYPLYDELTTSKCFTEDCEERATAAGYQLL